MISKLINKKRIEEISRKTQFHEPTVEKVLWLSLILNKLVKTDIGRDFALMGGSAIVFLYETMYRVSLDLDMDLIGNPELGKEGSTEIKELQNHHCKIISRVSDSLGLKYRRLKQDDERFLQTQLGFASIYGKSDSIDIDMGYRYCHSVLNLQKKPWQALPGMDNEKIQFPVKTLALEELWASKIVATIGGERMDFKGKSYLGSKNKIRNLYDTYYLATEIIPNRKDIDLKLLRNLVILFGAKRIKNFELTRGDILSLYTLANVEDELYPVLKKDKYCPELLPMQRIVRRFLDDHIFNNWGGTEYRFLEDFDKKIFRPQDLFGSGKLSRRLKDMYYYRELLGEVIKR